MRKTEKERTHSSFVALKNEQLGLVDQLDPNGRQNDGRSERRVESLQRQRVVSSAPRTTQLDMLEEGRTHFADDSLKAQSRARKPECGHTEGRLPTRVKAGAAQIESQSARQNETRSSRARGKGRNARSDSRLSAIVAGDGGSHQKNCLDPTRSHQPSLLLAPPPVAEPADRRAEEEGQERCERLLVRLLEVVRPLADGCEVARDG